jgi:Replication-relaxation
MAGVRQPRTERRPEPRPIRFQERDRFLLGALGKMRFLTTTQIAALGFQGSRWAAHKRMRKLLDQGLVRGWLRSLNDENVYSLDRAGAKVLRADYPIPRALDGHLNHLLSINQVRIACSLALPRIGGELVRWRSDWKLRTGVKTRVIPDALFEVRWADAGLQHFALEVDHRSRSTRGFVRKLLGYTRNSVTSPMILFVGHDTNWIARYRDVLARTRIVQHVLFTTFQLLETQSLATPIFSKADSEDRYSLRDLSALPYGKEGQIFESVGSAASFH